VPALAADLVRLKVDVIVTGGTPNARAIKQATTAIPIVVSPMADAVRSGLVTSLARPGRNLTGFMNLTDEMPGKWLELVKEAVPGVSRVAALWDPVFPEDQVRAAETGARALGVRLQVLKVSRPDDLEPAFNEAQTNRAGALIVLPSSLFYAQRTRLSDLAVKHRLPVIYADKAHVVESGGLMSYGADFQDLARRAAGYVDRILKGEKPGDLPVQGATKFELVINLRAAKALGLTIPPSLVLRADEVIR